MNYIVDHIPRETPYKRRQGIIIHPTTITIHGTANLNSGAMAERNWLINPDNLREASFHISVDDIGAVECIPLNEKALHAGDTIGNMTSIGIEICESGNRQKTLQNAAELVAKMLKERGWGIDHLRRHHDWSGKNCPRIFNEDGKWSGWEAFKKMVESNMKKDLTVIVNGKEVEGARMIAGSVYVPFRATGEALGAKVTWDNASKTATMNK